MEVIRRFFKRHPHTIAWVVLVAVLAGGGYYLVQEGREAHAALCVYKGDLEKRREDNVRFLNMTLDERVAKYGESLGALPESVIRNSLKSQTDVLDSLKILECD